MLRIRLIIALVLAAAAAVVAVVMLTLGQQKPVQPPAAPDIKFHASVFLAPGAVAAIPTTIRLKVWLSRDLLPVKSAEIDPDGDRGPLPMRALDVAQWKSAGETPGTFYFDLPWDGPENAPAVIIVHAGSINKTSNIATTLFVNTPSLQPWPGSN